MLEKIIIDFGNIVEEMERKQIRLCLLHETDWFIIDSQNQFYQIETYYRGGYLDRYITRKIKIEFNIISTSVSDSIEDWEKEVWDVEVMKKFIERQHLEKYLGK